MKFVLFFLFSYFTYVTGNVQTSIASRPYNTEIELCCNGNFIVTEDFNENCCHNTLFHEQHEMCCEGRVYPIRHLKETFQCCGSALMNPRTDMCCDGHVRPGGVDMACCGSERYHVLHEICCSGHSHRSFGEEICCGNKAIDWRTKACCHVGDGFGGDQLKILDKTAPTDECCDGFLYNKYTQICCDAQIHLKSQPRDSKCCGNTTYSELNGVCCKHGDEYEYHSTLMTHTIAHCCGLQIYGTKHECCGKQIVYQSDQEICCEEHDNYGRLVDALVYKKEHHFDCCGSQLFDTSDYMKCCKNVLYDPNVSECCGGTILERDSNNFYETSCCRINGTGHV